MKHPSPPVSARPRLAAVAGLLTALLLVATLASPAALAQDAPPVPLTAPLVYVSGAEEEAEQALVRVDEGGTSVLVRHASSMSQPAWSPDRSTIAYVRFVAEEQRSEVRLIAADGRDDRVLTEGVAVAWAPDGSRLAVSVVGDGLFTIRPDGSDRRRLTEVDQGIADLDPRWSPDGRLVAFLRTDTLAGIANPRLFVVNADGSGLRVLTEVDEAAKDPSWSPASDWIAVHLRTGQDEEGNFIGDVVKLRVDGSRRVMLSDGRPAFDPAWSPDGELLALAVDVAPAGARDLDLFTVRADGTELRRILDTDRDVHDPDWSPDAAVISFTGITCCTSGVGGPRPIWDVFAVARDGHGLRALSDDGLSMDQAFPPPAPLVPAVRLAGATRIHTAAAIALDRLGSDGTVPTVVLASALAFPDALAGSALAGNVQGPSGVVDAPLLLTLPDEVPQATGDALRQLSTERIVLLGGPEAISEEVERELAERYEVDRIAGADRFATAAEAARRLVEQAGGLGTIDGRTSVLVVSGERFPDALAAGPVGYAGAVPILLVDRDRLPEATRQALQDLGPEQAVVVGGEAAVSDGVAARIREMGTEVERVAGPTRTATAARLADFAVLHGILQPEVVSLARGDDFADALAGGADAGRRRAPILLSADPQTLSSSTSGLLGAYCEPLRLLVVYGGEAALARTTVTAARQAGTC